MGAWNFSAGLVLLVVIFNIQALEALPKQNSSDGLRWKLFPDFRQSSPKDGRDIEKVQDAVIECLLKWRATIGDPCISETDSESKFLPLVRLLEEGVIHLKKLKEAFERWCQNGLGCRTAGKCECKVSQDSSLCDPSQNPKDLTRDCCKESRAYVNLVRRLFKISLTDPCPNIGRSVSDPGHNVRPHIPHPRLRLPMNLGIRLETEIPN